MINYRRDETPADSKINDAKARKEDTETTTIDNGSMIFNPRGWFLPRESFPSLPLPVWTCTVLRISRSKQLIRARWITKCSGTTVRKKQIYYLNIVRGKNVGGRSTFLKLWQHLRVGKLSEWQRLASRHFSSRRERNRGEYPWLKLLPPMNFLLKKIRHRLLTSYTPRAICPSQEARLPVNLGLYMEKTYSRSTKVNAS